MSEVIFEVNGEAVPADFRISRWNVHEKPKVAEWKAEVRRCASEAMQGREIMLGAIQCTMCFVTMPPKSHLRANGEFKAPSLKMPCPWARTSTPDWDNLCKCAQDACTKVVWKDDAQIVWGQPIKVYGDRFHIIVWVREIGQEELQDAYHALAAKLTTIIEPAQEGAA